MFMRVVDLAPEGHIKAQLGSFKALLHFCSDAKICRPSFIKCINIETNDRNIMQIGISMPCVTSTG